MEPILQVKNISKVFPGVKALTDVSADFYPGEVHTLVGENGAGKSTLIKIISGVYTPTEGKVIFEGKEMNFTSPGQAIGAGIEVINQELSIAKELACDARDCGAEVIITRDSDVGIYTDDGRTIRQKKREDLLTRKNIIEES